jgi:hypothetical protein
MMLQKNINPKQGMAPQKAFQDFLATRWLDYQWAMGC